jgi:hypothetical protein
MPPGVPTVLICGQPAACVGDMATCTGPPDSIIPPGCPTVLIGSGGGGGGAAGSGGGGKADAESESSEIEQTHYLDVKFVDKGGKPITGVEYTVKAPDGALTKAPLTGRVKRKGLKEGDYEVCLKAVTKAEWSEKQAAVGEKVKLKAETAGIDSGEKAILEIFIRDANFADHSLRTLQSTVDGGKIEEEWELEIDQNLLRDQESKEGSGYSYPSFYFVVNVAGVTARSGLLRYRDYVEIELKDEDGNPAAGVKYKVYLSNGVIKEGTLDSNGYAKVENVPPGKVDVAFDVRGSSG